MTKIEELRAAYEATTPGEWKHVEGLCDDDAYVARLGDTDFVESDCPEWPDGDAAAIDANFLALAHNNMPALLEAVEALGTMRELLAQALDAHIYNAADGDLPDDDCPYVAGLERAAQIMEKLK